MQRGINVLMLDANRNVIESRAFDTHVSGADSSFAAYISGMPQAHAVTFRYTLADASSL